MEIVTLGRSCIGLFSISLRFGVAMGVLFVRCILWGFWCRLGLCRFEDDLDAKLMQVGVDLRKVAGGFIGEHEDKQQQDARMTGKILSRGLFQ